MPIALAMLRFPPIARINQPIALWFRATFLIRNSQQHQFDRARRATRARAKARLETRPNNSADASRLSRPHPTHRKWARSSGAAEIQEAGPCDHTQAIR